MTDHRRDAASSASDLPRIVIVGAGFGGLEVAKGLEDAPARITVLDRHNYNLFQPLLYQVATAGLSPARLLFDFLATRSWNGPLMPDVSGPPPSDTTTGRTLMRIVRSIKGS